jgi:hypothetical protein
MVGDSYGHRGTNLGLRRLPFTSSAIQETREYYSDAKAGGKETGCESLGLEARQ